MLIVFTLLVAWKVVRTDWIVICPWWEGNGHIQGSPSGSYDATFRPPVSPAWRPPDPTTSGILEFGSGNSFPRGVPWVRPYWEVIGFKIGFPLMLICSVHLLRYFIRARGRVTNLTGELIAESKRQAVAQHSTEIPPTSLHSPCNRDGG